MKVIKEWKSGNCYNYIGNKIGYRFELVKGSLQSTVKKGASFCLSLDIKNSGVAPLYNERPLEVLYSLLFPNFALIIHSTVLFLDYFKRFEN